MSFWYLSRCRFSTVCPRLSSETCYLDLCSSSFLLFLSLSLLRDPYVGSLLSVFLSVFRDLLLRSLFFLSSSLPLSLSRDPYVGSLLSVSPSVFRDLFLRSLFLLSSSLPLSLSRDPYVGSLLSVSPSVFRDLLLRSLFLLSLIHIWRCRRPSRCRSRWSPYH